MKTTIDISDNLMLRARETAQREGITLRELVGEGLELALQRREGALKFQVKPVVFGGQGLSPEYRGAPWERLRAAVYEGHGE